MSYKFDVLCTNKLHEKGLGDSLVYNSRLEYELQVVDELKFEAVFLICHDIITWAKSHGIRVGVGRGSAAGSLICYLLDITGLDPIKYELQFERFLIQGRVNPPDIDMDFQRSRRDEVYDHLESLLGKDHLIRLCTFSFMRTKAAIRDVGRALEVPLEDINKMLSLFPREKSKVSDIMHDIKVYPWVQKYPKLFEFAARLEGKPRHVSVHPAGVIISGVPIIEMVPIQYNAGKGQLTTAWDMYDCEECGLIKLDLLGLETLDVIQEAIDLTKTYKEKIWLESLPDIDKLIPDDEKIFRAFAEGATTGIFQFEKEYVQDILKATKVDCFDDLVALNALLRPGALAANAPTAYAERKHGKKINYLHEALVPILKPTYGLLVYQEQAIRIARDIAGFTITEADAMRKAIGKSRPEEQVKFRGKFIGGAIAQGYSEHVAHELWDMLKGAGTYMFNKSHSTCYSYIAYQAMYLKTYSPTAFWVALLNSKMNEEDELNYYINHLKKHGYTILHPSVMESQSFFAPVRHLHIRAGFLRLKGVGPKAAQALESLPDRSSMSAWIESMKSLDSKKRHTINKKILKILLEHDTFVCYNAAKEEVAEQLERLTTTSTTKLKSLEEMYLFGEPSKLKYQPIEPEKK